MKYIILRKFNTKPGWSVCCKAHGTFMRYDEALPLLEQLRELYPAETYKLAVVSDE